MERYYQQDDDVKSNYRANLQQSKEEFYWNDRNRWSKFTVDQGYSKWLELELVLEKLQVIKNLFYKVFIFYACTKCRGA